MGHQQQKKSLEAYQGRVTTANTEQMRENRELATKAYLDQAQGSNLNLAQTREAAAANNQDQRVKRLQAQGATMAAAAEGGVSGISLNSLLDDFHRQEDMFLTRSNTNLLFKQQQTAAEISGQRDTAAGRVSQIKPYIPSPIAPVDYFGPLLGIANSGSAAWLAKTTASKNTGNTTNIYN